MSCFWDSIYSQLNLEDYNFIGENKPPNIEGLVHLMKKRNKRIDNVTWQKTYLSHNEKNEHNTAIKVYNVGGIRSGHLTSVCDSFLLLVCEVFCVSIEHKFMGAKIFYDNTKNSRKCLKFSSNSGHFQVDPSVSRNNRSTQNRLDKIRNQAIQSSKKKENNTSLPQQNIKTLQQNRPSWRANPEAYMAWRERMRSMKIR